MRVLALSVDGVPRRWVTLETAMLYQAKNLVVWSLGDEIATFHGGIRRVDSMRSELSTNSIIAVKSSEFSTKRLGRVVLTNKSLFARDLNLCAYCGKHYKNNELLSRDHIKPVSKGGLDIWTNVVTACKRCNSLKTDKSLEQAGLVLRYVPYEPNHYENMILQNRQILHDQMSFLMEGVPKHSRLLTN